MSEILLASITAFGAILEVANSGFATYEAATIGVRRQQKQKQLLTSFENLQHMKKVEKIHFQRVAQSEGTGEGSLKREIRKIVNELLGRPLCQSTENKRLALSPKRLRQDF